MARDADRARRHRRAGLGDPPAPAGVGGQRAPRGLHRPAGRLPDVRAALPRRQARGRAAAREAVEAAGRGPRLRPDRRPRVQPDVRDQRRPGQATRPRPPTCAPRRRRGSSSTSRTSLQFARKKPPFGIAQVGKSFRNEITPGNFIFRTREFEQMEMEYFVPPDEAQKWFEHWTHERFDWYVELGIRPRPAAPAPARRRRALALLVAAPPTSSTCSRSAGRSWRASPTAATSTSSSTRSSRARSSSTSTRGRASATSRT